MERLHTQAKKEWLEAPANAAELFDIYGSNLGPLCGSCAQQLQMAREPSLGLLFQIHGTPVWCLSAILGWKFQRILNRPDLSLIQDEAILHLPLPSPVSAH